MPADIPPTILGAIAEGRAILFLGAGASFDALHDDKAIRIPSDKLKATLSEQFLGSGFKDRSLVAVADLARNESSLLDVQRVVRDLFLPLEPNTFHQLVPMFKWKAIVTTNYDLVVERAYQKVPSRLQQLAPVTKDGTELQAALCGQNTVPYLKLHGCINNFTDTTVPIVLDSLEYSKFSKGRAHLVTAFKEWATNSPVIFCGYSLADENIKQILFDIGDASQVRPQYLYVCPGLTDIESRYWNARRIASYSGSYADFMGTVDASIPSAKRELASLLSASSLSITKWIPSHTAPSPALVQYLTQEAVHVLPDPPPALAVDSQAFYAGLDVSFAPIYGGLDVRREQVDELIERVVLDTLKSTEPKFFVLRGYAGCGKSVFARRLAIETSALIDTPLVIYLPEGTVLRADLLLELQQLVQSRVYVFLDDLIEFGESLPPFLENLRAKKVPITILACSRTNEFNVFGSRYSGKVSRDFEIGDLAEREIDDLLKKLSANKLLGPLKSYEESERRLFVERFYGRQLLVALHEITRGSSFEDIVLDEFEKITPRHAQQIYLDICTLHQCRVGVRAGLISRLNGVELSSLTELLSGSLAKVIRPTYDHRYRDIVYRTRHEDIARMVFELAIPSAVQRADQLKRILGNMELDYSSDNRAFFELVKGKRLANDFEDKSLANSIFDVAEGASPSPSYLLHQRAILELSHKNGSLEAANDLLRRAEIEVKNEGYRDSSIQHTRANLLRRRANTASLGVEKERYRADARAILRPQLGKQDNFYPEHLYGQLLLDEIRDAFESTNSAKNGQPNHQPSDDPTVRLINDLSRLVDQCLRQRPDDQSITLLKAEFLKTLGKNPNAIGLLERYSENNPGSIIVTKVLAETLIDNLKTEDAIKLLRPAIMATPSDKPLNLALAKALIQQDETKNGEAIIGHLRRSFSDGDSNYEARLLFARCNMLYGDLERGKAEFDSLRRLYIDVKEKPRAPVLNSDGTMQRFLGTVVTKKSGYAFLASNEIRFGVFFGKIHKNSKMWESIAQGSVVSFALGFGFRGPVAVDVELVP